MENKKRKTLIVYPKFQFILIAANLVIMAITFAAVALFVSRSFGMMKADVTGAGIDPSNAYWSFIDLHAKYVYIYMGWAFFVGFVISSAVTLMLSHRMAGPIVRLKGYFKEISEKDQPDSVGEVSFRKNDFFAELPPLINSALKNIKEKKSAKSGFTLMELMITVSILSLVALGISTMMTNMAKQQRQAQIKNNMMQVNLQVVAASNNAAGIFNSRIAQIQKPAGGLINEAEENLNMATE